MRLNNTIKAKNGVKFIFMVLLIGMMFCAFTVFVHASEADTEGSVANIEWVLSEGVLTVKGEGEIPEAAFRDNLEIQKVIIEEGITSIEDTVFFNCTNLQEIELPDGLTSIGRSAFQKTGLTSVELPEGLTSIGGEAFTKCNNLTEITIPGTVEESGTGYWFRSCENLTKITLAQGTEKILDTAFAGITTDLQVEIPDTVTSIGEWAFRDCSGMKEIYLPEGLILIDSYAFFGCDSLTDVEIPDTVTEIGVGIFNYCDNVTIHCSGYSVVAEYALRKNIPLVLKDSNYRNAQVIDTQKSYYTTNSSGVSYNGQIDLVLKYEIREEAKAHVSDMKLVVLFPYAMELREDSLTLNGQPCETYTYRNHELTLPVEEMSGTVHLSINPEESATLSTMAQLNYTYDGTAGVDIIDSVNSDMPLLTVITSPNTNQSEISICGVAPAKKEVVLYIDDVEAEIVTAKYNGNYEAILNLPNPTDGKIYTIKAVSYVDGEAAERTVQVVYDNSIPVLEEAFLLYAGYDSNQEYFSKELDLLDLGNRAQIVIFNPEFGYTFQLKISKSELIEHVYVTSTRNGITKYLEAVWSAEKGCYITEGIFDPNNKEYVPGILGVVYQLKDSEVYVELPLVGMFIWIIDPSGYVYDSVSGKSLSGVTATIYYKDTETGEAVLWEASMYDQQNPQLTQADGAYAWNVPEGLWQVKFEKEGYQTAYSEWMEVPPVRTNVNIGMTPIGTTVTVKNPFSDVAEGAYYHDAVLWAVENRITSGYTETMFMPEMACTRAQVVTFLWRTLGKQEPKSVNHSFTDIDSSQYYYKAVLWAVENKITSGLTTTKFGPEETVTREQFVTFLYRANGKPNYTASNPFKDVKEGMYYCDAVLWAVENRITSGLTLEVFGTGEACTRGQVVTFLYRGYR